MIDERNQSDDAVEEKLDELFDLWLRPLRSRNARRIFEILIRNSHKDHITTLDMQTLLVRRGVDLSKREINAWLRSLQEAGLIRKGEDRGKPTVIEYDGKYTFDKWALTDEGMEIFEFLKTPFPDYDGGQSLKKDHQEITSDSVRAAINSSGGEVEKAALAEDLTNVNELYEVLDTLVKDGVLEEIEPYNPGSLINRLRELLGLNRIREVRYRLARVDKTESI